MLDCQVADASGGAGGGGEKRPRRNTKFIGISKHMELERARQAEQTGPDPWAVRKVRYLFRGGGARARAERSC